MTLSVPWLVGPAPLTIRAFTTLQRDPGDLWPLRHLIRQFFGRFSDFWGWWWWYFQTATKGFSLNFICTYASTFNPHGSLSSTEDFYTKTEELQKVKVKTTHWSSTIKNSEFCIPTKNAKSLTSGQEPLTPPKCQNAKSQSWCWWKWTPPTTTPPTPRAPPAGLFASSPAPWPRSLSSGGTSILVIDNTIRPDHVENLGRQMKTNWIDITLLESIVVSVFVRIWEE